MRKRIGKWLRRWAERWDKTEPAAAEPTRTGMEKMLATPADEPVMRESVVAPGVLDSRASSCGLPDAFVPHSLPGEWGSGLWQKHDD